MQDGQNVRLPDLKTKINPEKFYLKNKFSHKYVPNILWNIFILKIKTWCLSETRPHFASWILSNSPTSGYSVTQSVSPILKNFLLSTKRFSLKL